MNDAGSSAQHAPKSRPSGACASTGGGDRAFLKEMSGDESEEESDGDDSLLSILGDGTVSEEGQSEQSEQGEQDVSDAGSSDEGSPNERMIRGDKAEAARGHLFRKKGKVYMLTNTVTGKSYVGQTIQRPSARIRQHASGKQFGYTRSGKPTIIQRSVAKHGWDAFTWNILENNIAHKPVEILDERERYWIKEKQTLCPNGYNMDAGGQKGKLYTLEMRKARSKAMMPWARSEKSRKRKRELWADPEFSEARSKERKVVQNDLSNVQSRRDTWDAKRDERIKAISDPKERVHAIKGARNNAKQGVRKAIRRGVTGRDLWGEFKERWGSDEQWQEWLKCGECASWMPFVSRSVHRVSKRKRACVCACVCVCTLVCSKAARTLGGVARLRSTSSGWWSQ